MYWRLIAWSCPSNRDVSVGVLQFKKGFVGVQVSTNINVHFISVNTCALIIFNVVMGYVDNNAEDRHWSGFKNTRSGF